MNKQKLNKNTLNKQKLQQQQQQQIHKKNHQKNQKPGLKLFTAWVNFWKKSRRNSDHYCLIIGCI